MPTGVYKHKNRKPISERFWDKVKKTEYCWLWTAYKNRKGYGGIGVGKNKSNKIAHRFSYELHYGTIPKGMNVLHRCDNPPCVNPSHLFLGTLQDNNKDMMEKGRHAKGSRRGNSKLTDAKVIEIRKKYAAGIQQKLLGKEYGVSPGTISEIINYKMWKHI